MCSVYQYISYNEYQSINSLDVDDEDRNSSISSGDSIRRVDRSQIKSKQTSFEFKWINYSRFMLENKDKKRRQIEQNKYKLKSFVF